MIDISPVVPAAQASVLRAAEVFERHTGPWLVGLLIHGSALKGGFIPGCSDIDLQSAQLPDRSPIRHMAVAQRGRYCPFARN